MLEASKSSKARILNALSFPLPLSGITPSTMSSEIEAWRATEGRLFCSRTLAFPVGDIRWGLAATAGARHWIHIDSDGFGTFIDVKCGGKWWILFGPSVGGTKKDFAEIDTFLDNFDTNAEIGGRFDLKVEKNNTFWVAEAIYLSPGTRLYVFSDIIVIILLRISTRIMRPNTPHAVFTTDHCITYGGHYYSTSNLQDTFYAIVHCLMANNLITNTHHFPSRQLLLRMMQYFHKCFVVGVEEDGDLSIIP